jgi:hypothetical protein
VDKHANGVERVNKEVVRHLRCLVWDRNIRDVFDDPTVIPSVQYILNSHISAETGFSPFELTFGSLDKVYGDLLKNCSGRPVHTLLSKLNENLEILRAASTEFQKTLIATRIPEKQIVVQNKFQEGDLVLYDAGPKPHPKMASRHKGPYEVVRQNKNDVQVRDIVTGVVLEFSVVDLEPFFGDKSEAVIAARRDQEQHEVVEILSYRGDHNERSNLQFMVKYADGDILEQNYRADLRCEALMTFCENRRELFHVTMDYRSAKAYEKRLNAQDISTVRPGDTVYVDLKVFGGRWYESLDLPDWRDTQYVMEFQYTHWYGDTSYKKSGRPNASYAGKKHRISGKYLLGGATDVWNTYKVWVFGENKLFDDAHMVLVTMDLAARYPRILE